MQVELCSQGQDCQGQCGPGSSSVITALPGLSDTFPVNPIEFINPEFLLNVPLAFLFQSERGLNKSNSPLHKHKSSPLYFDLLTYPSRTQ